jgi:lipid II:glycine glycyltransferase (peptidoglycan interpeptide bridge formation enzyme)
VKLSSKIKTEDWQDFVNNHPDGNIFQSPGMYDFFSTVKKYEPLVLAAQREDNTICGIMVGIFIHEKAGLFRLFSSRFVVYGGPLVSGTDKEKKNCLDFLLKELIKKTKRKALFIQFRNYFSWEKYLDVFKKHGFNFLERLNYIIRIPDAGQGLPYMSASRRRQVRKGLTSEAEIIEPCNIEQVREFYEMLYRLYRFKVRKPLADWSFFENFYKLSIQHPPQSPGHRPHTSIGIIRLIQYKGKIIGGILAPVFKNKCIYEWYICGLDREYKAQYPSVLATWAAITYAMDNKIKCFDFMGVGRPDVPYGVRVFKARFGGELVNYGRLTKINNKLLYNIAELGYNVLAIMNKI